MFLILVSEMLLELDLTARVEFRLGHWGEMGALCNKIWAKKRAIACP